MANARRSRGPGARSAGVCGPHAPLSVGRHVCKAAATFAVGSPMIRVVSVGLCWAGLWFSLSMAQSSQDSGFATAQQGLRALEAAETALQAAWDALPLTFRKGLFVEGPASAFGSYVPREGAVFAAGEKI